MAVPVAVPINGVSKPSELPLWLREFVYLCVFAYICVLCVLMCLFMYSKYLSVFIKCAALPATVPFLSNQSTVKSEFSIPIGPNLDAFWMPFGSHPAPAAGQVPRPLELRSTLNFCDLGNVLATKVYSHFNVKSVLLTTIWRYVFLGFVDYPFLTFFSFGFHLGCHFAWFLRCLGTL